MGLNYFTTIIIFLLICIAAFFFYNKKTKTNLRPDILSYPKDIFCPAGTNITQSKDGYGPKGLPSTFPCFSNAIYNPKTYKNDICPAGSNAFSSNGYNGYCVAPASLTRKNPTDIHWTFNLSNKTYQSN